VTSEHQRIDPLLAPEQAEALRATIRRSGPYTLYVSQPIESGLGRGLTRRHDAALAWVLRELASGSTEPMDVQAARTNLFRGTWLERGERALDCGVVADHAGLAAAARDVLGLARVEPYMLYANLLLPGQELPVHHDTPEFVGLDKTVCPEWFLVVCSRSGLFEEHRIRVASAVAFVAGEGDLITFPDGIDAPPVSLPPTANTAVVLDADELVHGVSRVGGSAAPAPPVEIGDTLGWEGSDWALRRGGREIARYPAGAVRLSLQWKAWMFDDSVARADVMTRPLTLSAATDRLVSELRRRGHAVPESPDDVDLALLLMEEFIQLPAA